MNDSWDTSGSDRCSNSSLHLKSVETDSLDVSVNAMNSIEESEAETPATASSIVADGLKADRSRITNHAEINTLVCLYTEMIKGR